MPFAGSWLRGTLGASFVTLLVPGAVAIGVSAAALGGGLRGLGSLDQVVAGPKIRDTPLGAAKPATERRPAIVRDIAPLPGVPAPGPLRASAPAAPAEATTPNPSRRTPGGDVAGRTPTPRIPSTTAAGPVAPTANAPTTTAPTAPDVPTRSPAPPAPAAPPSVVRQTGETVASTVGALPQPVGGIASDAVTTLVDLLAPK